MPTFGPQSIHAVADELGLSSASVVPYGRDKAKLDLVSSALSPTTTKGKVVLVSAITPTPAGEGKTTTSIGLAMALRRRGQKVVAALREPSLGPVFGVKGGGTGGGKAQVIPSADINLHFNGDLHAITSAHNLLAALIDNELHFGCPTGPQFEARRVTWRRVLDMNDRALRDVVLGLGGVNGGVPRQTGFDITAASEVMAVLCLATSHADLVARLERIVVAWTKDKKPITAGDLKAGASMAALLKDALLPNLVQTAEGGPAILHGGPFANIAHGCSSVLGTLIARQYADVVVTEGGFGFDLGGEKFLDIKCRQASGAVEQPLWPDCVVMVATLRALKFHGGAPAKELGKPDEKALQQGLANLERHLESVKAFGLKAVVAINAFDTDLPAELELVKKRSSEAGAAATAISKVYVDGGEGGLELSDAVSSVLAASDTKNAPRHVYELTDSYEEKIRKLVTQVYGGGAVSISPSAKEELARFVAHGSGELPVCVAKTQLSVSDDPKRQGRPTGFTVNVREVRLSAGAGFVVAICGDMMTMPGLPKVPAAHNVRIEPSGAIRGLMQND